MSSYKGLNLCHYRLYGDGKILVRLVVEIPVGLQEIQLKLLLKSINMYNIDLYWISLHPSRVKYVMGLFIFDLSNVTINLEKISA